jgi:hypothetical protein
MICVSGRQWRLDESDLLKVSSRSLGGIARIA